MGTIKSGLNPEVPVTMANAPSGELYIHNGLDSAQRWDGQTLVCETSGMEAPDSACTITGSGSGDIFGVYNAYVRYLDDEDIPSNLSPIATTAITAGDSVAGFSYASIPVDPGTRTTQRQIWRNTAGQNVTLYLATTIADNTSVSSSDTKTDGELITQTSMRMYTEDNYPNANRFSVPPADMSVIVSFMDRMWFSVASEYSPGRIVGITGTAVTAEGTKFTQSMIGRKLSVSGKLAGTITAVPSTTSLTLAASQDTGFGTALEYYSIGDHDRRNMVMFSEANEPESVPSVNSLILQEDGDTMRGMMVHGSYLYLLKNRHIYRLTTAGDPRRDAAVVLVAERGVVNQRCWCRAEGLAFVMDWTGIYVFDGASVQSASDAIQDYFRNEINWSVAKWFSAVHAPDEQTVRFFVALGDDTFPKNALCYNYRMQQWHLEEYPFDMGCACEANINGMRRVIVGVEETVQLLSEGVLDGCAPYPSSRETSLSSVSQTTRGTVTGATSLTITDSAADFDFSSWHAPPETYGAPIAVIDSNGDYQYRRIASISSSMTTITVQEAWTTVPSVGDTYQIGAIELDAKFGTFEYIEEEQQNARQVALRFEPQTYASTLNVKRFHNHSTTAQTAGMDHDNADGVVVKQDSPNIQLDLTRTTGYLRYNTNDGFENHGPADRMLEVELKGVSGNEKTQIYALDIEGV